MYNTGMLPKNTFNDSKNIPLSLHFNSKEALSNKVCNLLEKNDIVLLKGSRSMGLDSVAEDIKNYVKWTIKSKSVKKFTWIYHI